ncbi:MAG: hypothetical protein ACIAXF_14030 [Phycisphaerales bacterium JB063]
MHTATIKAAALSAAALAAATHTHAGTVEFEGYIDINGFFPSDVGPPPDFIDAVVGMPVVGTLTYDDTLMASSNDGTLAEYLDPAGSMTLSFGEAGALGVYTSDQPLMLRVRNFPAGPSNPDFTFFSAEANFGNPETDPFFLTFTANFRFPGLDGTGAGLPLPGDFGTADLLDQDGAVGRGFITDEVGLTSYNITSVNAVPTPSSFAMSAVLLGLGLRRRRRA